MLENRFSIVRAFGFGVIGLVSLGYGILAILWSNPEPIPWPIVLGLSLGLSAIIAISVLFLGPRISDAATDESYQSDSKRAESLAFWMFVLLFIILGLAAGRDIISLNIAYVVLGSFSGATFLLALATLQLRGRIWNF